MINAQTYRSLETALRRLQTALKSPRAQRIAWVLSVTIFFGGIAFSLLTQPSLFNEFRVDLALIVLVVLCPIMTAINMVVTKELARLAGVSFRPVAALKLAVMSAAANHLPAPGGPLLRMAALKNAGARLKDAGLATMGAGIIWMGATFVFAGLWALRLQPLLGCALLVAGASLLALAYVMTNRLPGGLPAAVRLFLLSIVSSAAYAVSIYVSLLALGVMQEFSYAAIIASAGVIGAASSIAPSGLGVREVAAAGLAGIVGADPAAAFTATAGVHIAMAAVTGLCALYFSFNHSPAQAQG